MEKNYFKKVRILDGGMGQQLLKKGLKSKGTLWSAGALLNKKNHHLVSDIHLSFIRAGADVIVTNNFTARKIRMRQNRVIKKFKYANEQACKLAVMAKEKSKRNILIAGALPSQRDTYVEDKRKIKELEKDFDEQAKIISPYIDFFYFDVFSSGREIGIASNVAEKLNKKVLVGIHLRKNGKLPSGESIKNVITKFKNSNWLGIICSCVSPEIAIKGCKILSKYKIPYGFKINLWGVQEPTPVKKFNTAKFNEIGTNPNIALGSRKDVTPKHFYKIAKKLKDEGATILGGCCETKPSHIRELSKLK